jgi:hypothetical protein
MPLDVSLDVPVEALIEAYPAAAGFLAERGVICIVCGEAYWGRLGELMAHKGIEAPEALLADLKKYLSQSPA